MMVFYPQPFINLALKANYLGPKDRSKLKFKDILDIIVTEVRSFIKMQEMEDEKQNFDRLKVHGHDFIPDIAYSGLGLLYNENTGKARNPLDGKRIEDEDVVFDSCVDRSMIKASLKLKEDPPDRYFASCTRLCDVRKPEGVEHVANIREGELTPRLSGGKGIAAKLRSIHSGLYPQSDIAVTDDPWAEIAARTWIDQYGTLDLKGLMDKPYDEWLNQNPQKPEIAEAVNKLNSPFIPNTVIGPN
jgi:hypothetical protein